MEHQKIKEVKQIWKEIPELDAEIRNIQIEDNSIYLVNIGLFESLGETGGDILTEVMIDEPTEEEIIELIKNHLREFYKDLSTGYLSARQKMQLKVLKRLNLN